MSEKKISYGEESDLNLRTLISLTRCSQDVKKREQVTIKKTGVTITQFAVLEILYHKGNLKVCEITKNALTTGGNTTVVIDNLIKEGMVVRKLDPNDRRVNLISLTEKGSKIVSDVFPDHLANINEIFSVLTVEEKNQLRSLLKKLSGVK